MLNKFDSEIDREVDKSLEKYMKRTNQGQNWNSTKKEWSSLVGLETQEKANKANNLKQQGKTVSEIAEIMGLSKSRIYEYLRVDKKRR